MKMRIIILLRILFGGALLLGSSSSSCVSDALRDVADDIENQDGNADLDDVWDDVESWFD